MDLASSFLNHLEFDNQTTTSCWIRDLVKVYEVVEWVQMILWVTYSIKWGYGRCFEAIEKMCMTH